MFEGGREGLGIVGVARRPQPPSGASPLLLPPAAYLQQMLHTLCATRAPCCSLALEPSTTVNSEQSRLDMWRKGSASASELVILYMELKLLTCTGAKSYLYSNSIASHIGKYRIGEKNYLRKVLSKRAIGWSGLISADTC